MKILLHIKNKIAMLAWFGLACVLISADAPHLKEGVIVGIWTNDDDEAIIEIKKEGNFYVGILLKPAKGKELDKNGKPRGKERSITGLRYEDGEYVDGTLYIAMYDIHAHCSIVPINENKLKVKIRYGIVYRSSELRRLHNYKR